MKPNDSKRGRILWLQQELQTGNVNFLEGLKQENTENGSCCLHSPDEDYAACDLAFLRMVIRRCWVCFKRSGAPGELAITFSTFPKMFGFCVFSRISFRNGSILAKMKNISPEKLPSRKSSRLRTP